MLYVSPHEPEDDMGLHVMTFTFKRHSCEITYLKQQPAMWLQADALAIG